MRIVLSIIVALFLLMPSSVAGHPTIEARTAIQSADHIFELNQELRQRIPNKTLAHKNKNPGNLRWFEGMGNDFLGVPAWRGYEGFIQFQTMYHGFIALYRQIKLDASRDENVREFIEVYAPSHENETEVYINTIEDRMNISADEKLKSLDLVDLTFVMIELETGANFDLHR